MANYYWDEKLNIKRWYKFMEGDEQAYADLFVDVEKIVRAIINRYRFFRFDDYDELVMVGLESCINSLKNFNPNYINKNGRKTTLYSYTSKSAQQSIYYYTKRNQHIRNNATLDALTERYVYMEQTQHNGHENVLDFFEDKMSTQGNNNIEIMKLLRLYIEKTGDYNKREFFRFCRSYGWSPNLTRKFLSILQTFKDDYHKIYL
jgi:DNA-directed RNA polymerase specialized sigma24 family protein